MSMVYFLEDVFHPIVDSWIELLREEVEHGYFDDVDGGCRLLLGPW